MLIGMCTEKRESLRLSDVSLEKWNGFVLL